VSDVDVQLISVNLRGRRRASGLPCPPPSRLPVVIRLAAWLALARNTIASSDAALCEPSSEIRMSCRAWCIVIVYINIVEMKV